MPKPTPRGLVLASCLAVLLLSSCGEPEKGACTYYCPGIQCTCMDDATQAECDIVNGDFDEGGRCDG